MRGSTHLEYVWRFAGRTMTIVCFVRDNPSTLFNCIDVLIVHRFEPCGTEFETTTGARRAHNWQREGGKAGAICVRPHVISEETVLAFARVTSQDPYMYNEASPKDNLLCAHDRGAPRLEEPTSERHPKH